MNVCFSNGHVAVDLEVQSQKRHMGRGGQSTAAPHRGERHCSWAFQFLRQEHVFDMNAGSATKHCVLLNYNFWFFAQKITLLLLFDYPGRHWWTEKPLVKYTAKTTVTTFTIVANHWRINLWGSIKLLCLRGRVATHPCVWLRSDVWVCEI